jgi:DNA-directed RNA polymerase specialized sigma24 family protein
MEKKGEALIPREALNRVIEKESFAEILDCLTSEELLAAALRLEGLSDTQIGALLGLSRQAARQRLQKAQMRIIRTKPDLASAVRGRCPSNSEAEPTPTLPLEHGWLCDPWQ